MAAVALIGAALLLSAKERLDDEADEGSGGPAGRAAKLPHKIVYETNRDGNWELYLCNADGSNPVNLTSTKDVDELYPKPSPDGTKICFVADEGKGDAKVRNIYYMNSDGTAASRSPTMAASRAGAPTGTKIAYMKGEFEKFTYSDFATKGLFIYDLKTGKTREHVNNKLHHLYTLNWSPDGKWFVATVHGGMGFSHTILAIEADGDKVFDLKLEGCRPNISPDGKKVCWGHGDYCAGVADLDLSGPTPKAINVHDVVESKDPDRDLSRHLVAGHEIPHLHARPQVQGQEPEGPAAGVPRRRGAGLERVRRRCDTEEPLGRHHHRRQIVQAAELGRVKEGAPK